MKEKTMSRPPSFQFYPDKWQSHTRRLSETAYRVYLEIICWMWLHSPDFCSIPKDYEAISCLLAMPCDRIANAMRDIQNEHAPLLRVEGERLVSNGLRKGYENMQERRDKAVASAKARWDKPMRTQCERNANASSKQCSPTPTPSPTLSPSASAAATPKTNNTEGGLKAALKAPLKGGVVLPFESDAFRAVWDEWRKHRKAIKHPMTPYAEKIAFGKLPKVEAEAVAWIENAIERGWRGIYEPGGNDAFKTVPSRPAPSPPILTRDQVLREAVRALGEAAASGDAGISRCMKALHDKYKDMPKSNGQTAAGEALEIWKFQGRKGRDEIR